MGWRRVDEVLAEDASGRRAVVQEGEDGEYRVRLYERNGLNPDADYFTDDRADADGTAWAMVGGRGAQ